MQKEKKRSSVYLRCRSAQSAGWPMLQSSCWANPLSLRKKMKKHFFAKKMLTPKFSWLSSQNQGLLNFSLHANKYFIFIVHKTVIFKYLKRFLKEIILFLYVLGSKYQIKGFQKTINFLKIFFVKILIFCFNFFVNAWSSQYTHKIKTKLISKVDTNLIPWFDNILIRMPV